MTENWQTIPDYLKQLSTLVCVLFDDNGNLLEANRGFLVLTKTESLSADAVDAACFFPNPTIGKLLSATPNDNVIYRGILNIGPRDGTVHSLHGTVYRQGKLLWLVAEPDVAELENLNKSALSLNDEMAELGRELLRKNNLLKRDEVVIRTQMEQLQQLNNRLEQAQNQLLQAAKLASVGQLAAGVAHEINNPIGFIHSNFSTLENYIQDLFSTLELYEKTEHHFSESELATLAAAKQRLDLAFLKTDVPELLLETRDGINRVKNIVQHLKDFSHLDGAAGWQWVSLQHCLDSTLEMAAHKISQHADIIKEFSYLPEIECIPFDLNQVFFNLLLNAAQSIETRGIITLRAGVEEEQVWISIADNGHGIAAENLTRIFDPFFTTRTVGQSYGLGLSLAYSIVKKHHGDIGVSSSVGQGSTFRITLPIRQTQLNEAQD